MNHTTDLQWTLQGRGELVVLVHASFGDGAQDWAAQSTLAHDFQLLLLDRRGYGRSPARPTPATFDVQVFDAQAEEIAGLLGDGGHLVGHSYGGLLCLLAAVRRPEAVRSLTVIEPPAYAIARGNADVDAVVAALEPLYLRAAELTPAEFRTQVFDALGFVDSPHMLSEREIKNSAATMAEPPGWMATVPLDLLAGTRFPKLVVSGAWGGASASARDVAGRACTAVCRVLEQRLPADHAVVEGAGHAVQFTGRPFNSRLAAFLSAASPR